ncbi:MAG: molybdopterin dinucleotide binding domain-containing protein, partial [Thermodesulfobacteriota bacterium]
VDDAILLNLQRGEPVAVISVKDARNRGIQDGDFVEVYNDVGDFRIQAMVSPAVRPGQLIIYHGWENYQFEGFRHFKSVMASPLNPVELVGDYKHLRPDPAVGSAGLSDRDTRVEIRKADRG